VRFVALATDYDETLAEGGSVSERTAAALERLRASGRRLLLVTGRELLDLRRAFPRAPQLSDAIVAENGAVLWVAGRGEERRLAEPPPPAFYQALQRRGCEPLSAGRVIVSTREPWQGAVLDEIHAQGLELQVVLNKGAVMVLPPGVNKGTGLAAGLAALGLSPRDCVAVGDAENDHALLAEAGLGAAVSNALPALRDDADVVLRGRAAQGVEELIDALLRDDLAALAGRARR
jgi:hydroxymethylpyrimidine pyrophosphatase-like HAD family hydrolase